MPADIAVDAEGLIYVADTGNNRVRVFDVEGQPKAEIDGFAAPLGVDVDAEGNIYVVDTGNHQLMVFDSEGTPVKSVGSQGAEIEQFESPSAVAVTEDRIYVTDTGNHRVQVFDRGVNYQTQFGVHGTGPGEFDQPAGIDVDVHGDIYVADHLNHRIQVFDVGLKFKHRFGQPGMGIGEFHRPLDVATSVSGQIYATDFNDRIQVFNRALTDVEIANSIVAGNHATVEVDVAGQFFSLGKNLIGSVGNAAGFGIDDMLGTPESPLDPLLGPLDDNGGPTPTHVLRNGSPAIDFLDVVQSHSLDQRGMTRSEPFDVGAVERSFGEVTGTAFLDFDGDGKRDLDDAGIAGSIVIADVNGNGQLDEGEPFGVTRDDDLDTPNIDEAGSYRITGLLPNSTLSVLALPRTGFEPTSPFLVSADPAMGILASPRRDRLAR